MKLSSQKQISAKVLKIGTGKVWFDKSRLDEIKEAITRSDLRGLIAKKVIQKRAGKGTSRVRARKRIVQRRKGRQKGQGTRKGKSSARLSKKEKWMNVIRGQRKFIKELKVNGLIEVSTYRLLYRRSKGGYFRNKRHIKLFLTEQKLFKEKKK
ncbi:MAG: 50S ribosomal protein L19e [Nanoarchaeota archaeon]|nr:50S ribosomal protein L19e [Nanoarchaeota archaeon]